jgi:S1-C subfamily serine protease
MKRTGLYAPPVLALMLMVATGFSMRAGGFSNDGAADAKVGNAEVAQTSKPTLGLVGSMGFLVKDFTGYSPSRAAGMKAGDIIVEVNGKQLDSLQEFQQKVAASEPGTTFEVTVLRRDPGSERYGEFHLSVRSK